MSRRDDIVLSNSSRTCITGSPPLASGVPPSREGSQPNSACRYQQQASFLAAPGQSIGMTSVYVAEQALRKLVVLERVDIHPA